MLTREELPLTRAIAGKSAWPTWCVLFVLAAIVVLLNLAGRGGVKPDIFAGGKAGPHFSLYDVSRHGWPVTCVERGPFRLAGPPWWRLSNWRLWEGIEWFSWSGLLTNLAAGVGFIVVAGIWLKRCQRGRGLQFGVKKLLAVVAFCAFLCGWLGLSIAEYRRERDILRKIDAIEGGIPGWAVSSESREWERRGPLWLRAIAGDRPMRAFDRVAAIDTAGDALSEAVKLRRLRVMGLFGPLSNRQLALLAECPRLEALDLTFIGASDDGHSPELDSEGFEIEPDLELPYLPRLRGLNLYQTPFRGRGLGNIPAIEHLELTNTDVDDDGVAQLSGCPHLRILGLAGTKVSDASLPVLKQLSQLQELYLMDTQVSARGVQELQAALPNCQIAHF